MGNSTRSMANTSVMAVSNINLVGTVLQLEEFKRMVVVGNFGVSGQGLKALEDRLFLAVGTR